MTTWRRIEVTTEDGVAEAYFARPDEGRHPGVLLYLDAIGLRPQIEAMVDRIAGWGYAVLAPNVFYRRRRTADIAPKIDLGEPGARRKFFPTVMPLVAAHTPDEAARDLTACLGTLRTLGGAEGAVGVTGYCMGGRLALRAAAQEPEQVAAVGMFHTGGPVTDDPDSPHLRIPTSVPRWWPATRTRTPRCPERRSTRSRPTLGPPRPAPHDHVEHSGQVRRVASSPSQARRSAIRWS